MGSQKMTEWEYWKWSHTVSAYRISFVPYFICSYISPIPPVIFPVYHPFRVSSIRVSSAPRLICFASHLFLVSPVLHLICSVSHSANHPFHVPHIPCLKIWTISQLSDLVSTSSHVSESIMLDQSWDMSRKIYIERKVHPVFWNHSSDQIHNSTYSWMRFSLGFLTWMIYYLLHLIPVCTFYFSSNVPKSLKRG